MLSVADWPGAISTPILAAAGGGGRGANCGADAAAAPPPYRSLSLSLSFCFDCLGSSGARSTRSGRPPTGLSCKFRTAEAAVSPSMLFMSGLAKLVQAAHRSIPQIHNPWASRCVYRNSYGSLSQVPLLGISSLLPPHLCRRADCQLKGDKRTLEIEQTGFVYCAPNTIFDPKSWALGVPIVFLQIS